MRRFDILFIFFGLGLYFGCSTDSDSLRSDKSYFPLEVGMFWVYAVDETQYKIAEDPIALKYETKWAVVDSFHNDGNTYSYVIFRYSRESEADSWNYKDTWSARVDPNRAILVEENADMVKMAFPLGMGVRWDGNAFNGEEEDEYEVTSYGEKGIFGGLEFPDCVEVTQHDLDDIIVMTDIRKEIYARDVGLVYKETVILNFCTTGCTGLGEIENGVEYFQTIKEYGIE